MRDNVVSLPDRSERTRGRQEPIAVLDIGTDKMCCLIARTGAGDHHVVLGSGHQLAEGLRAGEMVDAEAVEASIAAVVHEAEQQAGVTVREVTLGISAGRPRSRLSEIRIDLGGRAVTSQDVVRGLAHAEAEARASGAEILHALPVEITLDESQPLLDPRSMIGQRLSLKVHLVEVAAAPLYNLVAAVERCHLDVRATVAGSYAGGLATLSEDELALGALVVDMGGGVTGAARFAAGRLQEIHAVPLGGRHVTQDLALGLEIGRHQAERLKTLYGSVLPRAGDARQRLEVVEPNGPDQARIVTRARLTEIARPRIEEIFQLLRARVRPERIPPSGRRLVLTGGASQLEGAVDLAEEMFAMPARLGQARGLETADLDLVAATTAAGLIRWTTRDDGGLSFRSARPAPAITARLARLGQWLRENF